MLKLTASLFQRSVPKRAASKFASTLLRTATPGALIYTASGPIYRVLSKMASPTGTRLRIARGGGGQWVTGSQLAALKPLSPSARRVAALVHRILAFDSSLSSYVDAAIEQAGLPKDPSMNWGRWLTAKYGPTLRKFTKDESLIDDAVREVVIHQLYELRLLDKDSPFAHFEKDHPSLKDKPLDKQVSAFLTMIFTHLVSEAVDYVKKALGIGALGELGRAPAESLYRNSEEDGTPEGDTYDRDLLSEVESPHDEENARLDENEVREFLAAFMNWVRDKGLRENTVKVLAFITNLIADGYTREEIRDELVASQFRGRDGQPYTNDTFKVVMVNWTKLLQQFAASPDNPFEGHGLLDAIQTSSKAYNEKQQEIQQKRKENKERRQSVVTSGLVLAADEKTAATQPVTPSPSFVPWFEAIGDEERESYTPVERAVTETPEFKEFFAGSKVVDVDGNPMVCFHGTSAESKEFTRSNKGYGQFGDWFDARPQSIEHYTQGDKPHHRPNVIPVYLAITKPKEFHDLNEFKGAVQGRFGPTLAARCQRFRMELKKAGYDGAVIRNSVSDPDRADYWAAFNPQRQVESALSPSWMPKAAASKTALTGDTGTLPQLPYSHNTPTVQIVDQKPQNPNVEQQTESLADKKQPLPPGPVQQQDIPPQITQQDQGEDDTQQPQKKPTIPPEIPGVNHV